ncbi:MAG: class I SAM-dependent DNA methyltransferase [Hyphomonas sp.]|jgi:type II restriction/modification system DNA methylase subunit YeeA|uniref:class I SAM-dependent DNA methyltransferase n=2 Tax=Alphaproteobacteria TaxID=28211 RepID=UPI0032631908
MTPADFIRKWERSELKESASAQSHFVDLCHLLDVETPTDVDAVGDTYCFEKGATKSTGGQGFADVWKKACFGWEYKGPRANLDAAYAQLQRYAVALENPPLLIVSDTKTIVVRTNWTNTVSEVHTIALTDLVHAEKREVLRNCFLNPDALKPRRTRDDLTKEAADEFSALAQRLRDRGHDPEAVAHFVNRLVFCMFAEDVDLLPNKLFQKAMERSHREPERAQKYLSDLFGAMQSGGEFGLDDIPWFNGGLFDSGDALPLDRDDVELAIEAAKLDWSDIDPSILGTLFERGLDPSKRSQLGAHYTDRDKIMMIVRPVIIEPLSIEWETVKAKIADEMEKSRTAKSEGAKTQAYNRAVKAHSDFIEKLSKFRVLDPACGSGNFLYLSLKALKDIEHKANVEAEALGLSRGFPRVGPEAVKGIELNPYAAELARVSIWIGEIQWMRANGFEATTNPILKPLDNIECRDAILNPDGTQARWPDANAVVGNPPFLGGKRLRDELGSDYVDRLFNSWRGLVKPEADLVLYWFAQCGELMRSGSLDRAGMVSTNSIRGGANRDTLKNSLGDGRIFSAWDDEPWVVDGAAVRVSLLCFDGQKAGQAYLDGNPVEEIFADLTARRIGAESVDLTSARQLRENANIAFQGGTKAGSFDVDAEVARAWLLAPTNPNGRSNADVLRPWINAMDVTRRKSDRWIIDFGWDMTVEEAALYEEPYAHCASKVRAERANNNRESYRLNWWRFAEPRQGMWKAVSSLSRLLVTPLVAKHRIFVWIDPRVWPSNLVNVVARDDDTSFGILHSRFHEIWALRMGTFLGVGNDPRYTPSTTFETFPFPDGLTPNIPTANYAADTRAQSIASAAKRLNELRDNWQNPPELIKIEKEVVSGFPDRIVPVDEKASEILRKRTLTKLYNERPDWLDNAHTALDRSVANAYGWQEDFDNGVLTDDEILKRLFELNQARAKSEEQTAR